MKEKKSSDQPAELLATDDTAENRDEPGWSSIPIVGVGASAGGLEAFTRLLAALPPDTGMGFVLVQHLDPVHESQLAHILSRATSLPVREISNEEPVEPNHVYVIPRDVNLTLAGGVLRIQPRDRTRAPHRPIDAFFESLAQDRRERAVGVVLSGTATDGTLGLEAIKAEGGITFAQDGSAKHDSMPRSAVAAGCVDLVLSPEEIARELARIARHRHVVPSDKNHDGYKKILLLLRNHFGVDFSLYKSTTIYRRITRRLVLNKHDTLDTYAGFLRGNTKELASLYSDVLISVTRFFRNPETFEILAGKVLPHLLEQPGDDPLRCWVLGCSTGQEAYSLAMAFTEASEKAPRMRKLQIFATDLNDALLDKARRGLYAKNLVDDVSPQRLRRFFVEEEGGYRIAKALREKVVFARQNLIADPPFSRMDLISCRNLLIYLEQDLQRKAMPTFHYALKPGGFLLLGASESIGSSDDLFEPVDKKHKIYSKRVASVSPLILPLRSEHGEASSTRRETLPMRQSGVAGSRDGPREISAQREADRITITQFGPPGVLVNAELQILQFRGSTDAFLEPPVGKVTFDVLKMAREGLMLPLRSLINQAKKENRQARKDNVRVTRNGKARVVSLEVIPLENLPERCFLILFEDEAKGASGGDKSARTRAPRQGRGSEREEQGRVAELEAEIAEMREYLQSMQEQHEASNEEVQSSNEEVQSANEELQSINEELETSKEELESANEELTTVNDEMSNRNVELDRLNTDLVNLQASTKLAVVLFGRDLTIRRFSPQAERQFGLMAADVGRPLGHIRHGLVAVSQPARLPRAPDDAPLDLEGVVAEVIEEVREQEREVMDREGHWRSLRVRPYMTLDNKVDGAVLVLLDIDSLKKSERGMAAARDYAENTVDAVREPLLVLDGELRVESANRAFYSTFRLSAAEAIGQRFYDLGNHHWDIPRLRQRLNESTSQHRNIEDLEIEQTFESLGPRTMLLNTRRIQDPDGRSPRLLLAIEDITDRKRAETLARESEERLRRSSADLSDAAGRRTEFLAMLGHELRNPLAALTNGLELLGNKAADPARFDDVRAMMVRQARRIATLLDQLLDIARVTSGKVQIKKERVDLVEVVRGAVETVRPLFDSQGHELTLTLPLSGEGPVVMGDAVRLSQVVENLLANAAKYTNRGGRIALSLEEDDDQVRIVVSDTGIGIVADLLPHVFEVFTQAPRALDRAKGGLGLGLPLVQRLVEMHGGQVTASSPGLEKGSEFTVTLPRASGSSEARAGREAVDGPPSGSAKLRILVVDDEEDLAGSLAELLEDEGHQALAVGDGEAALQAVRTFDPQVVLLDLGLPGMDGYEVARRLRASQQAKKMLLIAVTGYRSDDERLKQAGFDHHLIKPASTDRLSALLAEWAGNEGRPDL